MTLTDLYPYKVDIAASLSFYSHAFAFDEITKAAIAEDSHKIQAALPPNTLSIPTLEKICSLVRILAADTPIHIKGHGKNIQYTSPALLRNALDIIPTDNKGKRIFVSLHDTAKAPSGSQGIRLKQIVMLTFDAANRLSTSENAVQPIFCLATSFIETDKKFGEKVRRISIMQKMEKSPHFPTNYAFVQVEGNKGRKLRIFQEQASYDLLTFHQTSTKLETLSTDVKLSICLKLLHALSDLKTAGCIHRDIKLENILVFLSKNNTFEGVKLTDLGLAIDLNDKENLSQMAGSITNIAPEIIQNIFFNKPTPEISDTSEIWSLGLTINALCTGKYSSLQRRTLNLEKHTHSVKYAIEARNLCRKKNLTKTELAQVAYLMTSLNIPTDTASKKVLEEVEKALTNAKKLKDQALKKWETAFEALPKPPAKITTLQDLASAMLQGNPKNRISYKDAITAVIALQKSETDRQSSYIQAPTTSPLE